MGKAPNKCPMCGNYGQWKKIDVGRSGFSAGKAALGAVIAGPIGLVGGALGKKTEWWACKNCGFQHEYK